MLTKLFLLVAVARLLPARGTLSFREAGAWTPSVHALLRYLENVGFAAAPHVIGSGFDARGRETVAYIDGSFVHPHA
jgi:hypothetical protein